MGYRLANTRINRHSGDQKVSVFHKYSLGGDTTAPSGLYARLCHGFLVKIYDPTCIPDVDFRELSEDLTRTRGNSYGNGNKLVIKWL